MRNLTLISSNLHQVHSGSISATTYNVDEDTLFVASERNGIDGEVEVDLWKIEKPTSGQVELDVPSTAFQAAARFGVPDTSQIVSLRFIAEIRRVAAVMRGGDVIMISIEEPGSPFEIEGTFESGILAASWNPDDSVVAIVTGERKLVLLTSLFDVLAEYLLHTQTFGEDAPINVGWGSKQTQFHGSLGKAAAQATNTVQAGTSPDDDSMPRISWRGDGAYFVVSSLSPENRDSKPHRTLRVYDRQGALQTTSEEVAGLEHPLVWRPSGNLIASTQRFGFEGGGAGREGRHDIIFFEKNGLRHGEFALKVDKLVVKVQEPQMPQDRKWGYKVRELSWNSDSTVLAIWIEGDIGDLVQLWTTSNYHWYLKHEIPAKSDTEGLPGRFTSINWHPERALHLILSTSKQVIQRNYSWDTFISHSQPPNDSGTVAVLDGPLVFLTPFRSQNVPPPMSSYQLPLSFETFSSGTAVATPVYIAFSPEDDTMGILWENGYVELWNLGIRLVPGRGKVMSPSKIWSGTALAEKDGADVRYRQLAVNTLGEEIKVYELTALGVGCYATDVVAVFSFCVHTYHISLANGDIAYVGLAKTGKLYVSKSENATCLISTTATSLAVASGFIIYTTTMHETLFVPVATLPKLFDAESQASEVLGQSAISPPPKVVPTDWFVRKVERGSRIVVAIPSSMSLVLQMPRGNLETINPRPLVMEVVKQDLNSGDYRKAFFACRKHRVDLNVIVDHDSERFMQDIPIFIDQIPEVDHLNLLLTLVGRSHPSSEFVSKLCDAFRNELEKRDLKKYVNTVMTAHVVKTPPDHEAGLAVLLRMRDLGPEVVEDAVKYIIFLVDAESLFNTALGMYDFSLVIMIAQHAQKDPREYLPFLRELRAMGNFYQRFRIDDHLKRYELALKNLSLAGPERFDEAVAYVEKHRLYSLALNIWDGTDRYDDILNSFGDYLYDRRDFREAAGAFIEAKRIPKAMIAFEKALEWQELFDLATLESIPKEEIVEMAYRVAEDLASKKRHTEAACVLLDYSKDVREAVIALVSGNAFSEARRIISLNSVPELLEDIVHPAALESRTQIGEDIGEMREQLRKQVKRLRELRIKKIEEPDAFYGVEDNPALQNIDMMTDVSMAPTAFTRYTVAPTSASRTSRRTSRSKRKMERKVGSGRKGTVDEEEYLLRSVKKLVDRFNATQSETRALLPHLFRFTEEHRAEGSLLQNDVGNIEAELKAALDEIWTRAADPEDGGTDDLVRAGEPMTPSTGEGWAARMAEKERIARVNPLDKVEKPEISHSTQDWKVPLYDIK
ncbi:Elongator complex protein 1 [Crepidotus variabilis]|uniref:Elongator complex protein 1 n=1 Tax=Crepidotus variabilis TaxID=179855 RepID=A0A9P6EIL6_9AGAR|nr:Elongator complex protein 1 [Crepidotus variabilis]